MSIGCGAADTSGERRAELRLVVRRRFLLGLCTAAATSTGWLGRRAAGADGSDRKDSTRGDAAPPSVLLEPRGSLVIVGGGGTPDSVRRKFIELAGGKEKAKIVVIPTASESADATGAELEEFLDPWRKQGTASVVLVHTRSRERADDPEFSRPIDEATGVWFSGGDQSRITAAYLGTRTEQAFRGVLARGGVVGGTSAGAAVMSRVMITGGGEKATVGVGLGFIPGAVCDQHALRRSRVNRLLGVLADHPNLIGIAVDEATALVVQSGAWRVMGDSYVLFCRPAAPGRTARFDFFQDGDSGEFGAWKSPPSNARGD